MTYPWMLAPAADVANIAPSLIGWELHANGVRVRLSEVEAYAGLSDPASHAYRGPTPRTKVMFGPPGVAYLYFIFGNHWCLNMVLGQEGEASAVLLRAGEVVEGVDLARSRRRGVKDRELARGPAKLVMSLGLDGSANGTSMVDGTGPILLTPPRAPVSRADISAGPRVGVSTAVDVPWRFWRTGDPSVSVYRAHSPRRRSANR